ncbi:MAG TPA: MaoC family dehydratase N-terminal domain-containing protein [Acidimicrobiia bacterium]|nr:MaoC family dehydratase N-terminal domain-containing protein [Acidimicrobiia bacterium]
MANKEAIGATDQPFEMLVERGKIREFARATKSQNPAYLEDPEPVCEPTFLMTSAFWAPPGRSVFAKVGLDLRRVLHGGQEFVFHGPPPRAGTKLTAQSRIEDIYEKEGKRGGTMTFVIAVQEFRDEHGTLVAESRSTTIETGRAPEKEEG